MAGSRRSCERSPVIGLASGTVTVVPYDPRWVDEFNAASQEIHDTIGSKVIAVHHVGSTAVPGLCAKPILDILVSVADFTKALESVPELATLGYEFRPNEEIPDRHYFRRRRSNHRTHHLSLAEPSSHYHTVTLAFRDALRASVDDARRYCELKLDLARRFPCDREAYIAGKSDFVAAILARSLKEA